MRRATVLFGAILLLLPACGAPAPSPADPWTALAGPERPLPPDVERAEGRRGPTGGTILQPSSVPIEHGVAYRFALGHCGLASPVDLDGSFWVAVEGVTAGSEPVDLTTDPEMINATEGVAAVIGDEMRFRTDSGTLVRFSRHLGEREFPGCD
ncbi:MAG TPA: hypothetical protein VHQ42_00135 [Candidatus Limnocylindria bacterium]|nr:hypothetical protein [Candidatus Limnocylindria bacterium]